MLYRHLARYQQWQIIRSRDFCTLDTNARQSYTVTGSRYVYVEENYLEYIASSIHIHTHEYVYTQRESIK